MANHWDNVLCQRPATQTSDVRTAVIASRHYQTDRSPGKPPPANKDHIQAVLPFQGENLCNLLKPLRSQEIEQVEELFQVVLEWSPGEQQLVINLVAI